MNDRHVCLDAGEDEDALNLHCLDKIIILRSVYLLVPRVLGRGLRSPREPNGEQRKTRDVCRQVHF
jgi:hypothetical protein